MHVHAPTSTEGGYIRTYDRVGNAIKLRDPSGRSINMSWTVDGRLASVTDGASGNVTSNVTSYAYDPSGGRVKKDGPAGLSTYFGSLVERRGGNLITYYVAGDRLLARREGNQIHYYTQNQVHSTRVVTDTIGKVANRYDQSVFGRTVRRSEGVPQDQEFGGGRADEESGLTYMNARYYDAELMSFVSADTIGPDLHDPQSLHRYSFSQQDPINFWDPSGHMRARVEYKKELEQRSFVGWMVARSRAYDECFGELGSAPREAAPRETQARETKDGAPKS